MTTEDTPVPQVRVDFTLGIGQGRLDASVLVPEGEVTLTQLLPALRELSSNIVDTVVKTVNDEGYVISCKAGCGACCRQLVPLSLFEAEALADWIRSLPEEQQAVLRARFHQALLAMKESGFLERMDPEKLPSATGPEMLEFGLEYLKQKVPCPFLQDESCSIHPIRPLICREYLVTSPAQFCAAPTAETVTCVPMPVNLSTGLFKIASVLPAQKQGWIPLIFLDAWMKMNARPGDVVRAPGPQMLKAFIEECIPQPKQG